LDTNILVDLRKSVLFENVEKDILLKIAKIVSLKVIAKGERLITKGELGSAMYTNHG